jgi:hypothetical protein
MESTLTDKELDNLVEEIELLDLDMSKLEFKFDGLKEDTDKMKDKQPFMVRQIQLNERKMFKLSNILISRHVKKKELDSVLGEYRLAKDVKVNKKDNPIK